MSHAYDWIGYDEDDNELDLEIEYDVEDDETITILKCQIAETGEDYELGSHSEEKLIEAISEDERNDYRDPDNEYDWERHGEGF
jgi:hypothetical protein